MGYTFYQKKSPGDTLAIERKIDLYKKDDTWCIAFHTSSMEEYIDSRNSLKKMNFFWCKSDSGVSTPLLFQKKAITIQTSEEIGSNDPVYTILLKKKEFPDASSIQYAEDLLRFDSHEYLVSFFGENNVKRDVYFFSEHESKKCSVLFPNTSDQAVFIWENDADFCKLSYILISGLISTPGAVKYTGSFGQNRWMLKNGIYPGMRIGDLLKLNANDFKFYGKNSEFSFMVEPKVTGNINFEWIGVMLDCFNCDRSGIINRSEISAADAVSNDLAMHVSYIMIRR